MEIIIFQSIAMKCKYLNKYSKIGVPFNQKSCVIQIFKPCKTFRLWSFLHIERDSWFRAVFVSDTKTAISKPCFRRSVMQENPIRKCFSTRRRKLGSENRLFSYTLFCSIIFMRHSLVDARKRLAPDRRFITRYLMLPFWIHKTYPFISFGAGITSKKELCTLGWW